MNVEADFIKEALDAELYKQAVTLYLQLLKSMVNHFVDDEHFCYFDDMYSPEYSLQWIYEDIMKYDKMTNNILEQLEELYSRWSMAEKMGKVMQLEGMWQQLSGSYNYLFQIYQTRGYLTPDEAIYVNQLSQMLVGLQAQKIRVDQALSEEMIKHLAKMIVKR